MRYKKSIPAIKREMLSFETTIKEMLSKVKTIADMDKEKFISVIFDNRNSFPHKLAIAVIIKNEGLYILEWIEYHRMMGFSKFYIYDNDSTDHVEYLLQGFIDTGVVEFTRIHGTGKQLDAYQDAIEKSKNEVKWLAVLDADEFIQNLTDVSLLDILQKRRQVAMLVGWMVFGSNNKQEKGNGLVIERFTRHAREDFIADYKMILNPRKLLRWKNPHYAQMLGIIRDENGKIIHSYPYHTLKQAIPASKDEIRINHYYSKSLSEFIEKSNRGYADSSDEKSVRLARSMCDFDEHDRNEIEDKSMLEFVPEVERRIAEYKKSNRV